MAKDQNMGDSMSKYSNALLGEASPYLQQHAHNPVQWYPWGEEAFAKAKRENKPIFLSIGYATCHWCHVMEHESFEDIDVAAAMNENFISIKVDREERPDIDQVYMQFAQMMNGQGGWPLNVLLTPDKKPFYAATYIPKHSRNQRVGMLDLAAKVGHMWKEERGKLEQSAEKINSLLIQRNRGQGAESNMNIEQLSSKVVESLTQSFDPEHGGFGESPKFPSPHKLLFLLRQAHQEIDQKGNQKKGQNSLAMVEKTLDSMRAGGLFDQIGFGFHRYSTDRTWLLPHFEKMLYDQAMLMMAYTEAYQLTGNQRHAIVVREIAAYVLRDMQDKTGGFYSAEDADSEGVEGKFYVWSIKEIQDILPKNDAIHAQNIFNLSTKGNFHDEATGQKTGDNIPYLSAWEDKGLDQHTESIRKTLFTMRDKRIHPFLDDKILTDWNGLMIAALAKAASALEEPKYLQAAQQCADFLLQTMKTDDGQLQHRYRHGVSGIKGHLDDYAFFVWGLIELYESSLDSRYLNEALELNAHMIKEFTAESGGLYLTSNDAEALLLRPMEPWDGALPSGNAVAAFNMLRLANMTSDNGLAESADQLFKAFLHFLSQVPAGLIHMISAQEFAASDSIEIVLAGNKNSPEGRAMIKALNKQYLPHAVTIWRDDESIKLIPFIKLQTPINGQVTAYVCKNFQCNQPVTDISSLLKLIK